MAEFVYVCHLVYLILTPLHYHNITFYQAHLFDINTKMFFDSIKEHYQEPFKTCLVSWSLEDFIFLLKHLRCMSVFPLFMFFSFKYMYYYFPEFICTPFANLVASLAQLLCKLRVLLNSYY